MYTYTLFAQVGCTHTGVTLSPLSWHILHNGDSTLPSALKFA